MWTGHLLTGCVICGLSLVTDCDFVDVCSGSARCLLQWISDQSARHCAQFCGHNLRNHFRMLFIRQLVGTFDRCHFNGRKCNLNF